jgi:hypothetical protein
MSAEALAAWLGLCSSVAGVASSVLFALATGRTVDDESARNALLLLDRIYADRTSGEPAPGPQSEKPTERAAADLTDEILRKNKANRRDMKFGAWLLFVTFAFLIAQSLVMLGVAK